MRDCHLAAYRQAGFNPIAIASRNPQRAHDTAAQHGLHRVHDSYAELLADPEIEVLDIAVPPDVHAAARVTTSREVRTGGRRRFRGVTARDPIRRSFDVRPASGVHVGSASLG
jgi:hypothetical protein